MQQLVRRNARPEQQVRQRRVEQAVKSKGLPARRRAGAQGYAQARGGRAGPARPRPALQPPKPGPRATTRNTAWLCRAA